MPERPDLRQIASSIRDALSGYEREALVDILTYVFKEYVVEGPPPVLINQAERIPDLEGLGFAQLITALQTRLDLPELSLFDVDGDTVTVRAGGVRVPLTGPNAGVERPLVAPSPSNAAPAPVRPTPGVQVVETELPRRPTPSGPRPSVDEAVARGRGDIAGVEQRRGVAPRPTGLSLRGRPAAGGAMMPQAGGAEPPAPAPAEPPKENDKAEAPQSEPSGDDASIRFSLLELD